ncbi:MAG: hypothetical protein EBZ59_09645, partial [Planctomycetia bacterium]|nr:hypothetical protein [Planctomycetia bacterium]
RGAGGAAAAAAAGGDPAGRGMVFRKTAWPPTKSPPTGRPVNTIRPPAATSSMKTTTRRCRRATA